MSLAIKMNFKHCSRKVVPILLQYEDIFLSIKNFAGPIVMVVLLASVGG